jgi:cytochrome b involved in lipid metabolism
MTNKVISAMVAVIIVVGVGWVVYSQKQKNAEYAAPLSEGDTNTIGSTEEASTEPPASATPPPVTRITGVEVTKHNSRESCWSTINGNVYDLTSWIPHHPGGEQAILQICGINGSETYNGKHGSAQKQALILAGFKIGVAVK